MNAILRTFTEIIGLTALLIPGLWIAELIHACDLMDRKPFWRR